MTFSKFKKGVFVLVVALALTGLGVAAATLPSAAHAQASEEGGGLRGIFNFNRKASPIYINPDGAGQATSGGSSSQLNRPYRFGGTAKSKPADSGFASAAAGAYGGNFINASTKAVARDKASDAFMAGEIARGKGGGGMVQPASAPRIVMPSRTRDDKPMVYNGGERKPNAPIRLFDLR